MTTVGQLLSEAREQKKMTVQEVAEITKIRPLYLQALEEGRYNVFTSDLHAQGFLVNYSNFLDLNTKRIRALYRRERRLKDDTIKRSLFTSKDKPKLIVTPRLIVVPIIILAVLGVIVYFALQYKNFIEPPFLTITEPEDNIVVTSPSVLIKGQVERGTKLTINNEEVTTTNNLGDFEVYVDLSIEGPNKIIAIAEDGLKNKSEIERTIIYQPEPEEALSVTITAGDPEEPTEESTTEPETETAVEDVEYVYFKLARDEGEPVQKQLEVGTELTIGAVSSIQIITETPDKLSIIANNQPLELNPTETVVDGELEAEISTTTIILDSGEIIPQ